LVFKVNSQIIRNQIMPIGISINALNNPINVPNDPYGRNVMIQGLLRN
jgi:hypothetical protein